MPIVPPCPPPPHMPRVLFLLNPPTGPHCMRLSAVAYGALWRFHSQALPEDLAARCVPARMRPSLFQRS